MKITLSPMRGDRPLQISVAGDVLNLNGTDYDFTPIPEGATLPREAVVCEFLAGDIERVNGELQLCLVLPHGPAAPTETRFPEVIVTSGDGPIALPPYDAPEEELPT